MKNKKLVIGSAAGVICLLVIIAVAITLRGTNTIDTVVPEESTEVFVEETEEVKETVSFVNVMVDSDPDVDKFVVAVKISLYEEPSYLSKVLFDLAIGSEGQILGLCFDDDGNFNFWYRVLINSTEGYLNVDDILLSVEVGEDSDSKEEYNLLLVSEVGEGVAVFETEASTEAIVETSEVVKETESTKSSSASTSKSSTKSQTATDGTTIAVPETTASVPETTEAPTGTTSAWVPIQGPMGDVYDLNLEEYVERTEPLTDEEKEALANLKLE